MADVLIGENGSGEIAHDLMHINQHFAGVLRVEQGGLDVRVDFGPLLGPVGADGLVAVDEAAFKGLGPFDVGRHRGECGVDVAGVEGGVRGAEEADFGGMLVGDGR